MDLPRRGAIVAITGDRSRGGRGVLAEARILFQGWSTVATATTTAAPEVAPYKAGNHTDQKSSNERADNASSQGWY